MILECSSKGDKRFSAFYANITINNKKDSIENFYQLSKRFDFEDNPKNWKDSKGKKPIFFEFDNKIFNLKYLQSFYESLWMIYLDNKPELVEHAKKFDDFHDMFKSKTAKVCQADTIKRYINKRENSYNFCKDFFSLFDLDKEKTCCFSGHRPGKLDGYNLSTDYYQYLACNIMKECIYLIENKNVDTFISGGALGFDIIAFYVVNLIKEELYPDIKNIIAIPFKNQYTKWNKKDIENYQNAIIKSDCCVFVDRIEKYNNGEIDVFSKEKLMTRNNFMVDKSKYLITRCNDFKSGTGKCIQYAKKNNLEIIYI